MRIPTDRMPTPPGEMLLEEFLQPLGVTQTEFAARIGVSYVRVNEIIDHAQALTVVHRSTERIDRSAHESRPRESSPSRARRLVTTISPCREPRTSTHGTVSAVSLDERVADRGQVVSHTRRASHLEPFDQPGKLAGERVLVVAADHDLDAAVGRGTSHLESAAEHH